jgi:glucose-1-phosphate thymidylyltransferase
MKALILAAGYATRLRPLTDSFAKQLLPVGGRPMLDWILDKIRETDVQEIHLVTNARFAGAFRRWAEDKRVVVHDDGTTTNEDRLGALGDIAYVNGAAGLDSDDVLVIAGDNLFDYSLADYISWWRGKKDGSGVAVYDVHDLELVKQYSTVEVDDGDRIVSFVEKPENPRSTLAATATYLFRPKHVRLLVDDYLPAGNPPDQPGNFIAWLHTREPVYAYRFDGEWYDIGDHVQLLAADNRLRRVRGLPERETYTPD